MYLPAMSELMDEACMQMPSLLQDLQGSKELQALHKMLSGGDVDQVRRSGGGLLGAVGKLFGLVLGWMDSRLPGLSFDEDSVHTCVRLPCPTLPVQVLCTLAALTEHVYMPAGAEMEVEMVHA